ncbi:F-box/kelch-repeat protein At1g57790-like [Apium graveolens]|uniref:F-box/kelch-repeat protein At1g57790-like n=1 Tax=Apium graveolens TaxID=4045 RepID=UPI003D7B66FF
MIGLVLVFPLFRLFYPILHNLFARRYYSLPAPKKHECSVLKNTNTEFITTTDTNVWCELDTNILGDIMGRLCLTDQARLHVVCKNWLAADPINTNKNGIPWYLSLDRLHSTVSNSLEFRLYDPSTSSTTPELVWVHNISLTELGIPTPSYRYVGACFKNNWLFCTIGSSRCLFWMRRHFLLFSPYTRKVIRLPKLDFPGRSTFTRTFSTDPDSPNCVFFLIDACSKGGKIVVITCRKGDMEWTTRKFGRGHDFVPCHCDPIYFRGILYIVSPYGQLASYNIVDGEFKFESLLIDQLFDLNYRSSMMHEVFELNGELMLIYFGSWKKNSNPLPGSKHCIKRYDWLNKVWIPVSTLGNNTLFVSDKFLYSLILKKEEVRNDGVLSNKIYRFFKGGCIIYTIEDGDIVEFKSVNSKLLKDGGSDLIEYKYNRGISYKDKTKAFYWLEPPVVHF